MRGMKRILAMLLAVVMVVGLIPATVFAASDNVDYLFIATDRHTNTSVIGNVINNMESAIGENELDYLALGGDMVGSGNSHPAYNSSVVLGEVTGATSSLSATNVDIVAGIHDMNVNDNAGIVLPYSGGGAKIYEGDRFYVYGVEEYCISDDSNESNWSSEAQKFVTWANGSDIDKSKVIVVVSHYPLHAKRDDNDGAYYWHQALNTVATGGDTTVERNVFFFHGHNHTVDSKEYVYNVGDTMSIQNGSSTTSGTIYYTYATAGYLNQNSKATLMTITDDAVTLTKYGTSGSGTAMTSVERVSTTPTLSSIAISGTTSYYVGDELDLTVTATYSDGTTADVTADATLSGYDLSTAGTQTVTATYEGKTATATITVSQPATATSIDVTGETEYTVGGVLDLTVTATYDDGSTKTVTEVTTFAGCDLTASGTYTITATYGTLTDTIDVTVAVYDEDAAGMSVEAVSQGATDLTITWDNAAETVLTDGNVYSDFVVYNLALTDHTAGNPVTYTMYLYEDMDATNLMVYHVAEDGTLTEVAYKIEGDCVVFTTDLTGTFAYGALTVPAGYTLEYITVTSEDGSTYKNYFVDDVPYAGDFVVTAVYTKEGAKDFTRVLQGYEANNNPDGYEIDLGSFNMTTSGSYNMKFTYGDLSATFPIRVWGHEFTSGDVTVSVDNEGSEYGVINVNVATSTNANVESAIGNYISTNNYKAYDITLTYEEGYSETKDAKTVTLPIPEGVTNPVVCYVSEDGLTVDQMDITNNGDGTVSFETNHFSIYVIGDSAEDPEKDLTLGSDETKTVYVLVDTPTAGNQYIIVSTGTAGGGYALKENTTTGTSVTINAASGSLTAPYIETSDETIMWNATSGLNFQSENGGYYLNYSESMGSYSVSFSTRSASDWTAGTNRLYRNGTRNDYYLRCNGSTWAMGGSNSTYNVYFYEKQTVTISSKVKYEVSAENIEHIYSTIGATDETEALTYELLANGEAVSFDGEIWTVKVVSDPSGIIDTENSTNETLHFTGATGTATMRVYYELDGDSDGAVGGENDYKVWTTFTVTASNPYYTINLHKANVDEDGNVTLGDEITDIITRKNVKAGDTYSVWAVIKEHNAAKPEGTDLGDVDDSRIYWTVSDESIATIDTHTGVITFTGNNYGTIIVTARYLGEDGKTILCEDSITISVSATSATVPSDGTDDFPEYPDEGAVRHDKTATAVGNFSETGIAKVELSMTGVPYTTGSEIDVVVMLDMTGSMSDNGMEAAEEATKAFVKLIVTNEDGSYNKNRVAVYAFNSGSSSPYELVALGTIGSDAALETANTAIDTASDKQASGGTPFDEAAQKCYDVLQAAKTDGTGDDRQQFCVFMSDGGPTSYAADAGNGTYTTITNSGSGTTAITTYFSGYNSSTSSSWSFTLPTEYYTNLMKADGVTVYTVGLLLQNKPSNPSPYSSMTASTYDSTTDSLTTVGSHYYFTSRVLKQMASEESKYIDIFNVDNADKATAAFESIAKDILAAATDVTVADKIGSDYTMVFDAPNAVVDEADGGQEYYIEVIDYELEPVYADDGETITDYTRGTATSLLKLYFGYNESGYFAATDASGTKAATPVFEKVALGDKGTKFYWTTDSSLAGEGAISVVGADSVTYYFYSAGMSNTAEDFNADKWYNMTSGAYASGTNTTVTLTDEDGNETTSATCQNMIIASPYFVYDAESKMLIWTIEEISSSEMTLTYFLYLNNSGGFSGTDKEIDPATYTTNQFAYVNYTNFNGNECQLDFPVPQMTWNGAQVSYVFYLVNAAGQPVNRAGRVVPFSEAVYVTDVYTYAIIWNDLEQSAGLDADRLAAELVPEVYELYDNDAAYSIHVYEDTEKSNLNNHFVISGNVTDADYSVAKGYTNAKTTYVFNTKADANKYNIVGAYVADDGDNTVNESGLTYWCKDYSVTGTFDTVENTGGLYGTYYTYTVTSATYTGNGNRVPASSMQSTTGGTIIDGYVYYVDDEGKIYTIVAKTDGNEVEAGFDFSNTTVAFAVVWKPQLVEDVVVIDYGLDVVIDVIANDGMAAGVTGVMMEAPNVSTEGTYDTSVGAASISSTDGLWTASKENLTSVRFHMNEMGINAPVSFYYEAGVNYYPVGSDTLKSTNMYSKVTVIPATTVYYEDSFVTFSGEWSVEGTTSNKTQDVDRPGENKLNAAYDADNVYGYDAAYSSVSTYSMGAAHKVHVDASSFGTATFTFWGTGFDVIGMTSGDTGVLAVKVEDAKGNKVASKVVDTYYGYTMNADGSWTVTPDTAAALYQVPVMQASGLDYGKYTVTITATYVAALDQTTSDGYDLYLDAIRIYDPTGVVSGSDTNDTNGIVSDAYLEDGEAWPTYIELRDQIISAKDFNAEEEGQQTTGAIFIDQAAGVYTIDDYTGYGPNNELYLANGQAIAFNVADATAAKDVQLGIKLASGDPVTYTINGDSYTVSTATDMYYSILKYAEAGTVVIQNVSGGILSLTNIKVTFAPDEPAAANLLWMDGETATFALMSLRRAPADNDDSSSGDTTDTETEDSVTDGNTNTGNTTGDNTNTEVEDTVTGETNAPEVDNTVTEGNGADDTTTNEPAEDIPVEEIPEEDTPAEEETTEEPAEQLGFWARLWNAIKNAFNRLFSWFGF